MKSLSNTGFALFGAALIAISYGLARFAFGLFVPPIRAELGLTPDVIGIIGALPLISFLLATLVAPLSADRLGARNTAALSAGFGVVGLALISQASGALVLCRSVARRGRVRMRHMHGSYDAGAHGCHAGDGEPLGARPCQFSHECGHQHWCGRCRTGGSFPVWRLALRVPVLRHFSWDWRRYRVILYPFRVSDYSRELCVLDFRPRFIGQPGWPATLCNRAAVASGWHCRHRRCRSGRPGRSQQPTHHTFTDAGDAVREFGTACCQP